VTAAEETIQYISMTTGSPVTELLTNCLPLCMSLVLSSYAVQHHSGQGSRRDEHPVALHNLLLIHLSEEVMVCVHGCVYMWEYISVLHIMCFIHFLVLICCR